VDFSACEIRDTRGYKYITTAGSLAVESACNTGDQKHVRLWIFLKKLHRRNCSTHPSHFVLPVQQDIDFAKPSSSHRIGILSSQVPTFYKKKSLHFERHIYRDDGSFGRRHRPWLDGLLFINSRHFKFR